MNKVSVHIVTYNSENDIAQCLEALNLQSYPINEIVVVDNNSTDGTIQKVQTLNHITLIQNEKNTGFAEAHNQAIQETDTDYVLVLNPDVILYPDYIRFLVSRMEENALIGMATGKLYRSVEDNILDSTGIIMKKNRRAIDRGAGDYDDGQYDSISEVFGVSGAAAMYKRKMIQDISYNNEFYDQAFFAYKEDVDVCWRARLAGWKGEFVPLAVGLHKRGWSEKRLRKQVPVKIRQHSYINRYFYLFKNDSLKGLFIHFPFIFVYEMTSFCYAMVREPEILKAWMLFIKNLSGMWKKRKAIHLKASVAKSQNVIKYFQGIW